MWAATVDFQKSFDSVEHSSTWEALRKHKVGQPYRQLLKNVFEIQSAQVTTDAENKQFGLWRGPQQGDPRSSLLFNAVFPDTMGHDIAKWT